MDKNQQHMAGLDPEPDRAVGKRRLDVGARLVGPGHGREVQLPELAVCGGGPQGGLVLEPHGLEPHSPALKDDRGVYPDHGARL